MVSGRKCVKKPKTSTEIFTRSTQIEQPLGKIKTVFRRLCDFIMPIKEHGGQIVAGYLPLMANIVRILYKCKLSCADTCYDIEHT